MPSTPTLSDIWEHTLTNILRYDSKSETGRLLRFWVKHHKLEEYYQLLSWDIEEFTSHGALNSSMEKPNCEKSMPSTTLRQMNMRRQFLRYI